MLELSDPFKICARCIFKLPRQRSALNEFISLLSGYRNRVPIQSKSFHFSIGIASFFQEIPLCFVQSLSTLSYFHHSILRYLFPSLSLLLFLSSLFSSLFFSLSQKNCSISNLSRNLVSSRNCPLFSSRKNNVSFISAFNLNLFRLFD